MNSIPWLFCNYIWIIVASRQTGSVDLFTSWPLIIALATTSLVNWMANRCVSWRRTLMCEVGCHFEDSADNNILAIGHVVRSVPHYSVWTGRAHTMPNILNYIKAYLLLLALHKSKQQCKITSWAILYTRKLYCDFQCHFPCTAVVVGVGGWMGYIINNHVRISRWVVKQ